MGHGGKRVSDSPPRAPLQSHLFLTTEVRKRLLHWQPVVSEHMSSASPRCSKPFPKGQRLNIPGLAAVWTTWQPLDSAPVVETSHSRRVSEWERLCANKTLFAKTDGRKDLALRVVVSTNPWSSLSFGRARDLGSHRTLVLYPTGRCTMEGREGH